jgi:RimJ/RimL family protein N-acetyltransferase
MQLTLSQSVVRSFRPSDAASMTKHIGTYRVARYMSAVPHPYTREDAEQWIAIATGRDPQTHFGIAVNDEIVGGIGVEPDGQRVCAHDAEIGYWLGESFWGRGIMSEAVVALSEWAFTELGRIRLHATVYAPNVASTRVLEKAGYEFEGRLRSRYLRDGEFIDGFLYAKVCVPQT